MKAHTAVLLINLGTPDSPGIPDVRKYLREFLMDERVIDIPFLNRFLLVNGIIAPFRAPKSARVYKKLWTKNGSPLKYYGKQNQQQLQESLGNEFEIFLAMRYQNPSIPDILEKIRQKSFEKLIVIPLFPQYASATNGSVIQKVQECLRNWNIIPELGFIAQFYQHPLFIKTFADMAARYMQQEHFDHIIMSYHGIPERQIKKGDIYGYCHFNQDCCSQISFKNHSCYRAQCYETSRLISKALNISEDQYTVCFQSRLGKTPWIKPYTDEVIPELARNGNKKILTLVPSFVADCLETTIEVGEEYQELFYEHGGEKWVMVESLNDHPQWIACLKDIVEKRQVPEAVYYEN